MSRRRGGFLGLVDLLSGCTAFVLAVALRLHHAEIPLLRWIPTSEIGPPFAAPNEYVWIGMLTIPLLPIFAWVFRVHDRHAAFWSLAARCTAVAFACALSSGFVAFAFKLETISRLWSLQYFLLVGILELAIGLVDKRLLRRRRRVLVLGDEGRGRRLSELIERSGAGRYEIAATIDADETGAIDESRRLIENGSVDAVVLAPGDRGLGDALQVAAVHFRSRDVPVHLVPRVLDDILLDPHLARIAGSGMLFLDAAGKGRAESLVERAFDVSGAAVLSVIALPIAGAIALAVRLSSPGPVLFRQERVGRHGNSFQIVKFRSMVENAEEQLAVQPELYRAYIANGYKLANREDPRITRVGRLIRPLGLDELPQLWNVLCGEMSLVGPRPLVPPEIANLGDYAELLLAVKPGITGLWQVSGHRTSYAQRARLDAGYVLGHSLLHDVAILLRTIPAILRRGRPADPE
jgi:exopolysaccharide biosynthesis polyprenyl glycosylphosphotransferase